MNGVRTVSSADGTPIGVRTVGAGEPVVVVGGVLRSGEDYLPLARALAHRFEVHVIDRRGRGASGPQGSDYSIEKEREDLDAVLRETRATGVFGHSYGGLVALEAAKREPALRRLAVYEPGVSVCGSIPLGWMDEYARRLAGGDTRGAFAAMVRGSGHAPAALSRMPLGLLELVMRLAIRDGAWRRMEPLLEANLAEHQEVQRLDGTAATYERITAEVLLLGGSKSPRSSMLALEALDCAIPNATIDVLDGLTHNAPDERAPARVAGRLERFFGAR